MVCSSLACPSNCHLHLDSFVRLVSNNFEIIKAKAINIISSIFDNQLWKGSRTSLQLLLESIHMIYIHMRISNSMNKIASL